MRCKLMRRPVRVTGSMVAERGAQEDTIRQSLTDTLREARYLSAVVYNAPDKSFKLSSEYSD